MDLSPREQAWLEVSRVGLLAEGRRATAELFLRHSLSRILSDLGISCMELFFRVLLSSLICRH